MKSLNLKILAILLSAVLSGCATEHALVKEFKQFTENCEERNTEGWLKQLNQLEHHLYEQAYDMPNDEFTKHFRGQANNTKEAEAEGEDDYYASQFVINDLAENDRWKIIEVLYLQLYSSWGVSLVENKKTGLWT